MKLTLKSLDAEMRRQFDEVHQRIDKLQFKIDAIDQKIDEKLDAKLDVRFAQFGEALDAKLDAKLDARFSKFTADVIEGLSPWMDYVGNSSDDHKRRITAIEQSEVV